MMWLEMLISVGFMMVSQNRDTNGLSVRQQLDMVHAQSGLSRLVRKDIGEFGQNSLKFSLLLRRQLRQCVKECQIGLGFVRNSLVGDSDGFTENTGDETWISLVVRLEKVRLVFLLSGVETT